MKKYVKIFFPISMFILMLALMTLKGTAAEYDYSQFYENAKAYGFKVSTDYKPYFIEGPKLDENGLYIKEYIRKYEYSKSVKDKLENMTTIYDMILVNKIDPTIKCYAYKVISRPYQPGRYWGFLGIGSYGDNFVQDYVDVSIQFPTNYEIMSYAPINSPSKSTTTIGVGVGTSGFSISASTSFDYSDLTVNSYTDTSQSYYEAIYDFDQNSNSNYIKNEVASYGMILYKSNDFPNFKVNYDIKYHDVGGWEGSLEQTKETINVKLSF